MELNLSWSRQKTTCSPKGGAEFQLTAINISWMPIDFSVQQIAAEMVSTIPLVKQTVVRWCANLWKLGFFSSAWASWWLSRARVYNQARNPVDNFRWKSQRVTREKRGSKPSLFASTFVNSLSLSRTLGKGWLQQHEYLECSTYVCAYNIYIY